jgi:hypothetical protein
MKTYVCNFCGGDHGATECDELICSDCFTTDCECSHDEQTTSGEAIETIGQRIGEFVPKGEIGILEEQFGFDLPIELFSHVVATYPIPPYGEYLKQLFPIDPPDDGRMWNCSRKFGACYEFAFQAQQYEADRMRELVGSDEEVFLVQGYVRNTGDYIGHAWVEVGDFVFDCGSLRNTFRPMKRDVYYSEYAVKYPNRYTTEVARKKFIEMEVYGSWSETPDDIPLKEYP